MGTETRHPEHSALVAFALGRAPSGEMGRIEAHLETCAACRRNVETVPEDHLMKLLRRSPGNLAATSST